MCKHFVSVAIDGPAGAGKSTIARELSKRLNFIYVDTGALYRTIAFYVIRQGIDPDAREKVAAVIRQLNVELKYVDGVQHVFANGEDATAYIRTPEISEGASKVSVHPEVREMLFDTQQHIAATNNVIMDGRDIGTVVLPHATVKIFLTASPEARAERRFKELHEKGDTSTTFEELVENMKIRDERDRTRPVAPLVQAADAVLLDTSALTLEQSIAAAYAIVKERIAE